MIRAAYRALMRRYHPDADPSSEASRRAQAINDAYAVLGDAEKRARYDGALAAQGLISLEPPRRSALGRLLPRPGAAAAIGLAGLAAALLAIAISPPTAELPVPILPGDESARTATPIPTKATVYSTAQASSPCGDPLAPGLIKEELFRRAAQLRPDDTARLSRVASRAVVRIESPSSRDDDCHGFVALDLPPGLVVDEGRANLNAEIGYGLAQRAGRMSLTRLTGANGIVRSLVTLGPPKRDDPDLEAMESAKVASVVRKPSGSAAGSGQPASAMTETPAKEPARKIEPVAQPSFNCRVASGNSEKMICGSVNLAALDRQAALLYSQSWGQANDAKRSALLQSRAEFVERRNKCGSESCLTNAYVARIREISDIMAGRRQQ